MKEFAARQAIAEISGNTTDAGVEEALVLHLYITSLFGESYAYHTVAQGAEQVMRLISPIPVFIRGSKRGDGRIHHI